MSKKRNRTNSLYNIALNHNMQKCAYLMPQYKDLTQESFSQHLAARFPGLTKQRLQEILKDYESKGLENTFSIHALQLYCDLLGQSPTTALSEHRLFPSNAATFDLFTWNDIELLDLALSEKAEEFLDCYYDDLPIQIPIRYSPKDMVLLYLELYEGPCFHLELDFRISCYASSWGANPNQVSLDYAMATQLKYDTTAGVLPRQGQSSNALRERYDNACKEFIKMCESTESLDSFERINCILFDILDRDIFSLEGSFSAFCSPESLGIEDHPTTPEDQTHVSQTGINEETIDRNDDQR